MPALGARLHYAAGTGINSVDQLRAEARRAATMGFEGLWVSQIFGVDPFVALAALGVDAEPFAELGTSVVPTFGRHPLTMAALARTAQSALDGRFTLGIGPSHQVFVEGVYGLSYAKPFSHTVEYLDALLPLLAGVACDVTGEQIEAHAFTTIECDPVPVLLAALGSKMIQQAGARTAGTTLGSCGPRMIAEHVVPDLRRAAADARRPEPRVMANVLVSVTDDPAAVYEQSLAMGAGYAQLPTYRRALDLEGVESGADLTPAGTAEHVLAGLQAYIDAGVTDLRIGIVGTTDADIAATEAFLTELNA